jgi:hypothetical protein
MKVFSPVARVRVLKAFIRKRKRVALQNLDVQRLVGDQSLKPLIFLLQLAQSPRGVPRFLHNTVSPAAH